MINEIKTTILEAFGNDEKITFKTVERGGYKVEIICHDGEHTGVQIEHEIEDNPVFSAPGVEAETLKNRLIEIFISELYLRIAAKETSEKGEEFILEEWLEASKIYARHTMMLLKGLGVKQ